MVSQTGEEKTFSEISLKDIGPLKGFYLLGELLPFEV